MQNVVADPKTAEAMAALGAMQFCRDVGFFDVMLEGDAAQVIAEIKSDSPLFSMSGLFVESIGNEIKHLWSAIFLHTSRETNMAAHVMAKHALICKEDRCWLEDILDCISHIVCRETISSLDPVV
jgi:ribonuclease HI